MSKKGKMVEFIIYTTGMKGAKIMHSQYSFTRTVKNFDVDDLKATLYQGQQLNFYNAIRARKLKPDEAYAWEEKYWQAPTGGNYEDFLDWCVVNDYIDSYVTDRYNAYA